MPGQKRSGRVFRNQKAAISAMVKVSRARMEGETVGPTALSKSQEILNASNSRQQNQSLYNQSAPVRLTPHCRRFRFA